MSNVQNWAMIVGTFSVMLAFMAMVVRVFGKSLDDRLAAQASVTSARFDKLDAVMSAGFEGVGRQFEQVDKRFDEVDRRFEQVDNRFERVENRLERIEDHVAVLDRDVTVITRRLMGPEAS